MACTKASADLTVALQGDTLLKPFFGDGEAHAVYVRADGKENAAISDGAETASTSAPGAFDVPATVKATRYKSCFVL
jgi:hypothetical protein